VRIDLLGPLDVRAGATGAERSVDLSGARLRGLLIRLAVDVPRPVSQATLVEALWGEEPPLDPANALQSLVSRLRRGLGDAHLVVQMPGGYRLGVERDDVDMHRFADAARRGRDALRSGDAESAAFVLREALDSWHGPTPEGWGDTTDSTAHQARLCEQRLDATADLMEAEIALHRHDDVISELEDLVSQFPLRERFTGQLVRALAGAGRQAEALAHTEGVPVRKAQKARGGKTKDPDTVALEKRVSDALGLAVNVDHRDPGGVVHIRYRDLDQLDEIVRRLDKGV